MSNLKKLSIILPAKNESASLKVLLPELRDRYPHAQVIVVDDGSSDETLLACRAARIDVISHPYPKGNGAAIKTGARAAEGDILVFMDADGQHDPADISRLLDKLDEGFNMVVGARSGHNNQSSFMRWGANQIYNWLAGWMVGHRVDDLTSGFRAVQTAKFREFLHLLPNGFSYPTTSTMAFFRAGYSVGFTAIKVSPRQNGSKSHIRLFRDGIRFMLIIFRVGTLYSPLKLFLPISLSFFAMGALYYAYTFATEGRFTNGTGLLLMTSVLIFMIGFVSEQITHLLYSTRSTQALQSDDKPAQ